MTIPSESDLLTDLNLLATYENLRRDGSFSRLLPLVAMLRQVEAISVEGTATDNTAILEQVKAAIGSKADPIADKNSLLPNPDNGAPGTPYSEISLLKANVQGLSEIYTFLGGTLNRVSTEATIMELVEAVRLLGDNLPENSISSNVSHISSDSDSELITKTPILISGKAITAETYAPNYTEGSAATLPIDKTSGALLTYGRRLTTNDDKVSAVVETSALPEGAATNISLLEVKQKVSDIADLLPVDTATETTLAKLPQHLGSITEEPPVNESAPSGLNGLIRLLINRLTSLLPSGLSNGRLKVEQRSLSITTDKVGVAIESTVLAPNAATDATLIAIYNRLYKSPWMVYNHSNVATACIKPSLAFLHSFYCTNISATTTYFLQFFNKLTIAANGDTPMLVAFELLAGDTIAVGDNLLGERGIGFDTGLTYGFSTQRDTFQATTTPNDLRVTFYYE